MRAVDTNLLVRLIARDDVTQVAAAQAFELTPEGLKRARDAARVTEVRVISRSSAFSYKGKDLKLGDIARELTDVFAIQDDIAGRVAIDPDNASVYGLRSVMVGHDRSDWPTAAALMERAVQRALVRDPTCLYCDMQEVNALGGLPAALRVDGYATRADSL